MAHYRLSELDLSTRMTLALEMLPPIPEREWGRVTELAHTYDVSLLKGSVRDIRQGLDLLLGVRRSVGYISQTLSVAGEQAVVYNRGIRLSLPILGEGDEIFQ